MDSQLASLAGVLQCVAVFCNMLQRVAVCCSNDYSTWTVIWHPQQMMLHCVAVCCSVLQHIAACYSVLQCEILNTLVLPSLAGVFSLLHTHTCAHNFLFHTYSLTHTYAEFSLSHTHILSFYLHAPKGQPCVLLFTYTCMGRPLPFTHTHTWTQLSLPHTLL